MILAAYHPCYLPPISFFAAMQYADLFVLTDDFQFSTSYDINRTKVKTAEQPRWMTIPVLTKDRKAQLTREVVINPDINWPLKHIKTLRVNYTFAPYFQQFEDALAALFQKPYKYLLDFNLKMMDFVRDVLGIGTRIMMSSELKLDAAGPEKLMVMTEALHARTYLTSPVFRNFLRADDFTSRGLALQFFLENKRPYHQLFGAFEPDLSIIDLILNEGVRESKEYLHGFYENSCYHPGV